MMTQVRAEARSQKRVLEAGKKDRGTTPGPYFFFFWLLHPEFLHFAEAQNRNKRRKGSGCCVLLWEKTYDLQVQERHQQHQQC